MKKLALGVLGSGKGSNMVAIAEAITAGKLDAEIKIVISDFANAGILDRAAALGLKARSLPTSAHKSRLEPELEEKVVRWLQEENVELVVLAGYMRIIKEPLLKAFPHKIINIHPSLLPKFKGLEAWKQALKAGEKVTGCTVHYVDAGVDTGEIIAQREVPILPGDTPESLHARIQEAEHTLLPEVLQRLSSA
jgi:phosphoribosylglycinamide formyltransferase-1